MLDILPPKVVRTFFAEAVVDFDSSTTMNISVFQHELTARLCLVLFMLFATMTVKNLRKRWMRRIELDDWILLARKQRDANVHNVLTMKAIPIKDDNDNDNASNLWRTAAETRDMIATGRLSSTENIIQISKRCRTYGRAAEGVNGITEELYDDAYRAASAIEDRKEEYKDGDARPPLLGVPMCVKDFIGIKGTLSTGGLACRLNRRDKEDALIIKALKAAGGIPIVKGNVVQGMGLSESVNRIWGRSRNPYDLSRTPGGSSSGDAAIVASGCVPLSVSADGAGSIRIPASFCGVVGFKPSPARLSFKGCMRPKKDDKFGSSLCVPATIGPMARSVEDCALFMKAVCSPIVYKGDRNIPQLDFDDKVYQDTTSKLKIGYFMTDDFMEPVATCKRAMREAIAALERQGHICVPFQPPTDGWYHNKLFVGITQAEGNMKGYRDGLEGEPMIPDYAPIVGVAALPNFIRPIVKLFVPKRIGHLLGLSKNGGLKAHEVWNLTADLMKMKSQWSDAVNESGVDAIIFPSMPIPATRHGKGGRIMSVSYMFLANLLAWPSGALPITTVREDEQHYRREDIPKDQRDMMSSNIAEEMKDSAGLPMSISVMTPGYEDEKCLRVMKLIEKEVNFQARPTAFQMHTF